jgi:actin-like ATPase involved in cell morphogenesis
VYSALTLQGRKTNEQIIYFQQLTKKTTVMKILPFTKEIAIDLGTANNTIIIADGKIAVEEPSVVAIFHHSMLT